MFPYVSMAEKGIKVIGMVQLVSIRNPRMRHLQFPSRKGGIFRTSKEIEGLRGGVPMYAAQENPKIDAARAEKGPFRTETS